MTDPWHLQRWAYDTPTGGHGRKAVLVMLAIIADAGTGRGEVKVITLAQATEMGERTVRGHLRALEDAGLIARRPQHRADGGRRGDEFLVRAPEVTEWPDGTPLQNPPGPPASDDPAPSPEAAGQERPLGNVHASRQEGSRADAFPDDLPPELHDVAVAAGKILKATALKRGQRREVTRAAVGHAVLSYPDRDHLKRARDVEHWLLHGRGVRKSCADIVSRYRRFLDDSDPVPGPAMAPTAAAGPSPSPANLRDMAADLRRRGM